MIIPELRPPTLWERFVFKITKRWPQSYVNDRLDHSIVCTHLAKMRAYELDG